MHELCRMITGITVGCYKLHLSHRMRELLAFLPYKFQNYKLQVLDLTILFLMNGRLITLLGVVACSDKLCKQVVTLPWYWTWYRDAAALCFPHCGVLYISWHGFNCLFCALAYSVCYENKIIVDGDTEIINFIISQLYDFCVANDVAVFRLHTPSMICSAVINYLKGVHNIH